MAGGNGRWTQLSSALWWDHGRSEQALRPARRVDGHRVTGRRGPRLDYHVFTTAPRDYSRQTNRVSWAHVSVVGEGFRKLDLPRGQASAGVPKTRDINPLHCDLHSHRRAAASVLAGNPRRSPYLDLDVVFQP